MLRHSIKNISNYWTGSVNQPLNLYEEDTARSILIAGCIRQEMIMLSFNHKQYPIFQNIPNGMMEIVLKYHGQIRVGFMIFNNEYVSMNSNNLIQSSKPVSKHKILMSNIGFNQGINKWIIRCKSSFMHLIIGVIANPTNNEINRIQNERPWVYDNNQLTITKYWDAQFQIEEYKGSSIVHNNELSPIIMDVIVTLDCNENWISFESKYIDEITKEYAQSVLNKTHIIKLHSHYTWYPILGFYYFDEEYESICCDCWNCNEITHKITK
mmetsp:Transcript_69169/g.62088  ORF Transcript_69169/g.62088 Transcript_69169/m.62088 type:complete len:268 (+) Transcript_69169:76-879(+)